MTLLLCSLALLLPPAAPAGGPVNLIRPADLAAVRPFVLRYEKGRHVESKGGLPGGWGARVRDESTSAEVFMPPAAVAGARAVGLRNTAGAGTVQVQIQEGALKLTAGETYVVSFDYLTRKGRGAFRIGPQDSFQGRTMEVALTDTAGRWRQARVHLRVARDGAYTITLENYAVGAERTLYFKGLSVRVAR